MKNLFLKLFILSSLISNGQEITKKINIPEKHYIISADFFDNGGVILKTNKFTLNSKGKEANILNFNSNLDLQYQINPKNRFHFVRASPNGKKVLFNKSFMTSDSKKFNILDEKGNEIIYDGKEWLPNDFVNTSFFITDKEYTCIGYFKNRKDIKKGKSRTYQIFKRNLTNFETEVKEVNAPKFEGEEKRYTFFFLDRSNDDYSIITKDFPTPLSQRDIIGVYDYNSLINKTIVLNTTLNDENLSFPEANYNSDSYKIITRTNTKGNTSNSLKPTSRAYGGIYLDKKNKKIYTYSLFTSKNSKYGSGFLLTKYNWDGTLLWSKREEIFTKKNHKNISGFQTSVKFNTIETDKIGLTIFNKKEDYFISCIMNKENGDLIEVENFDELKRIDPINNLYSLKGVFPKNIFLNPDTVIATIFNPEVKQYISSKTGSKAKLYFLSTTNVNGVTMVQVNNKNKEYKVLKFVSK